jgi:selenocysteine lyase/cysteine desulfurase
MEHNSVMRPLRALEAEGVRVVVAPCALDGTLDPMISAVSFRENNDGGRKPRLER